MAEKEQYRLFAARPDEAGVRTACQFPYRRITPQYILIYTNRPQPAHSVELTGGSLGKMTRGDREWLYSCNISILAQAAAKAAPDTARAMMGLMDKLEAELQTAQGGGESLENGQQHQN